MAFAVKRDAPSVALARFEYRRMGGEEGRGEKKKNRSLLGQKL